MKFGDDNYLSLETREPFPALRAGGLAGLSLATQAKAKAQRDADYLRFTAIYIAESRMRAMWEVEPIG